MSKRTDYIGINRLARLWEIAPIRVWVLIRKEIIGYKVDKKIGTLADRIAFERFAQEHPGQITYWQEAYAHCKTHWAG